MEFEIPNEEGSMEMCDYPKSLRTQCRNNIENEVRKVNNATSTNASDFLPHFFLCVCLCDFISCMLKA